MDFLKGLFLALVLTFLIAAGFKAVEDQYFLFQNMAENPGFENGIGSWTTSGGTLATTTTAANVANGSLALSFDPSAAAQIAENASMTIPPALYGAACALFVKYKGGGTANIDIEANNGSTLGTAITVSAAATNYTIARSTFTCPTSGSLHVEMTAAGDAAELFVDDFWIGLDLMTTFGGGGGGGGNYANNSDTDRYLFSIQVQYSAGTPSTATGGDPESMVSSYTDTATGDLTINLNSVCSDTPFCNANGEQGGIYCNPRKISGSSTSVRVLCGSHTGSSQDPDYLTVRCSCLQ